MSCQLYHLLYSILLDGVSFSCSSLKELIAVSDVAE